MNVLNKKITHRQFGAGTVVAQDEETVTILFGEEYGEKKFLYPAAFESFLRLCDPDACEQMDCELRRIRAKTETLRRLHEAGYQKIWVEKKRKLMDQKKAQAQKRSTQILRQKPHPAPEPKAGESENSASENV
ncbi:MAG TPA: hypothetical protein PLU75_00140 [Oscillospiraceae bacterium]|mgnify:CR=1 FL=1|nr:hypothetical protein [Oscillospiraceae bacterium]HQQ90015.1 hypothetical protein [Oscillospiraceae bacterium]HRW56515.1 hypothetical protein [Oscillospiraceae bacterium]